MACNEQWRVAYSKNADNYMIDKSEMIFGVRAVIEAIQAGKEIDKILVKKDIQSDLSKELFAALKGTLIPVQRVPVERINRITRKNHQGVVAFISSVTYQKTEDLVPFLFEEGKSPFFVMLDGITDVRNFGAIARTCECAGVDAVIIPAKGSVTVNADAMKTSAGALHTLPVCREQNLKTTLQYLKDSGFRIVAATERVIMIIRRPTIPVRCASLWAPRIPVFRTITLRYATNGSRFRCWAVLSHSMCR